MAKAVLDMTEQTKATRVVLDSLSEVGLLARDPLRYRRQILAFKEYFSSRACTVLMLDDRIAAFTGFSPSHKREYIEWISEAKTAETRQRRMATALEWLSEGKARHWKYQKHG
jgi:bacteriocin resistance YdeI/OmpD-like protein